MTIESRTDLPETTTTALLEALREADDALRAAMPDADHTLSIAERVELLARRAARADA